MSDPIGEELAGWGKVLLLTTLGRVSRQSLTVAVGFVDRSPLRVDVAAGGADADWALNLRAEPSCTIEIAGVTRRAIATELDGVGRAAAVRDLILRYGTPAERLGVGPAFALEMDEGRDAAQGEGQR